MKNCFFNNYFFSITTIRTIYAKQMKKGFNYYLFYTRPKPNEVKIYSVGMMQF